MTVPTLHLSIGQQRLQVHGPQGIFRTYTVSTGKNPPSNRVDSRGTPTGWPRIAEKYGDGLPPGEVLIHRRPTARHFTEFSDWRERGYVVTRILRLEGLEEGINRGIGPDGRICDSRRRCIYIHGTCFKDRIGDPHTAGCIAMAHGDLIELFGLCSGGEVLWSSLGEEDSGGPG